MTPDVGKRDFSFCKKLTTKSIGSAGRSFASAPSACKRIGTTVWSRYWRVDSDWSAFVAGAAAGVVVPVPVVVAAGVAVLISS